MKKLFLIILLFVFAIFCIFCFGIKDMDDWEKEINSLKCVESVEVEKLYPDDDESNEYNMKIFLTEDRYLQIKYFNPYKANNGNNDFIVERIGNIVPVSLGYNAGFGWTYYLDFYKIQCEFLNAIDKRMGNLKGLLKYYDEIACVIQSLPDYPSEITFGLTEKVPDNTKDKPMFELWNKYHSPYVYSVYTGINKKSMRWKEYKLYKMTVEEYNDYMISRGWESRVIEENP